jgi:hypothetical protein
MSESILREQLARLIDWDETHADFNKTMADFPEDLRGVVPPGLPYSAWQLLEHIRLTQADVLEFCVGPPYVEKTWPEEYWPKSAAPPSARAWEESLEGFRRDAKAMKELALDPSLDLYAKVPAGTGQTFLREFFVVADHTSYHLGQIILVRRLLGVWS